MREPIPLASIFREVFTFLEGRADVAVFGAHAVNMYAKPKRMTEDFDMLSTDASKLTEELRARLATKFRIAIRTREVAEGRGFRLYQLQKPENRHLVDLRQVDALPPVRVTEGVQVVAPQNLLVMKVESFAARGHTDKGAIDRVDVHRMMNTLPELRHDRSIEALLKSRSAAVLKVWRTLQKESLPPADDDW